jgi:2-methylcitrate dehydratase PrpD
VIANEIAGRLGAAVLLGPQNGQLWTHLHAVGCACAGARLLNLDAKASAHALALALYQPPFAMWPGFMGPDSKLLSAAMPARDGLLAARLAAWGLTGPLDILDHPRGFPAVFSYCFMPQMLTGLGRAWVTDTLSFKVYPGCAYVSAALDGLFEAAGQFQAVHHRPLEPADVLDVTVQTSLLGFEMERLSAVKTGAELSPVQVNFSIPFSLAVALQAGRLTPAELEESELARNREALQALAERISVSHDWGMTVSLLEHMGEHLPMAALLHELELKQLLTLLSEQGRSLGGILELKPKDTLRLLTLLWERAPALVKKASRAAVDGLGRLVSDRPDPAGFDLGAAELDKLPMAFGAEVTIRCRGDLKLRSRVEIPRGAAGRDPAETRGLVRKKFREQATPLITEARTERALGLIEQLESVENLAALTSALCVG